MREVADRAGVALSSVSRVLSGHPDVSTVMRNRVLDAIAALGYEPNLLARSLRQGTTNTVGFVVGDISNPLLAEVALGAETVLRDAGLSMLLMNSDGDPALDTAHIATLRQRRVDGLLLSLADETWPKTRDALSQLRTPYVLIDREVDGGSAVLSAHADGAGAAVRHLIGLGHRRIALITGPKYVRPSRERAKAIRRICRLADATAIVRTGAFTASHGEQSTRELLEAAAPPTAIIAGSNQILVGVLRALRAKTLRVPEDVSLVTCDHIALAEFLQPPLATIARDPRLMGQAAGELLLDLLAGGEVRTKTLPVTFLPTASCAPPAR